MGPTPAVPALNLFSLKGQNVLITGATRGIGATCAIGLVEAEASICLAQRHGPKPNLETYNTIKTLIADDEAESKRTVEIVQCDLDNLEEVKGLFDRALEVMPGKEIHVLVNCAGIQRPAPAVDFSEADWGEALRFLRAEAAIVGSLTLGSLTAAFFRIRLIFGDMGKTDVMRDVIHSTGTRRRELIDRLVQRVGG
ncbi:hypothetical protein BKA70DRAFT_1430828 [Coprinopsis sp. MPI-PUGE-AT-0042]|nr:hypothetical protein BKA70DRAFT_1430828 [Coprinopsis sp. MPI-PUGE-AT-0042]